METPAEPHRISRAATAEASAVGASFSSDSTFFEGSLSKWDVCRGRRNVDFWLEFLSLFHSRYVIEKNRLLKKEIVNEAISKWISSGGRFLSKCSDGYCVLSDRVEQQPVAAYYFRNYRSMGLTRRSSSRAALLTSPSALSLDISHDSDKSPPDSHFVSPPSQTAPQMSPEVARPRNLSFGSTVDIAAPIASPADVVAPAVGDSAIQPKRRSPRFRGFKSKAVVGGVVPTKSKLSVRKKTTEPKRFCNITAHGDITVYLRRTSPRLRQQRSARSQAVKNSNPVSISTLSNKSRVSVDKAPSRQSATSKKRKRSIATTESSEVADVSGDTWYPQMRDSGVELLPIYRERLSRAGIDHWYDYAANLLSHYEGTKAKVQRLSKRRRVKRYVPKQGMQKQLRLHRHISKVRRKYGTERDHWGQWLVQGEFRGFSSIWTMQLTLSASDVVVKPIVEHLIGNLHFQGPASVLDAISARENSYEESVSCLASHISTCINYRKASAIIALAVICILIGKIPNSYEEIVSVPWVGPKCAYEALKEGFGCDDAGVGCDIHMCRMFGVLGWSDPVTYKKELDKKKRKVLMRERYNHDRTSMQIMSWLPQEYWGEMNHIYAGLGQLLQKSDPAIRSTIRKDLLNVPERWMAARVSSVLSLPQYAISTVT